MLEFDGLATQTEVWLDGVLAATHGTMFRRLLVPVPDQGVQCIEVCARALQLPRGSARPRWRNRLAPTEALRGVRTSLIGRMPGTGEPIVGPFRPLRLHGGTPLRIVVRSRVEGEDGAVEVRLQGAGLERFAGAVRSDSDTAPFVAVPEGLAAAVRFETPDLWWPHTHGPSPVYFAKAELDGVELPMPFFAFRTIERAPGPGFGLLVNGVPVFCRGALLDGPAPSSDVFAQARQAGFNMVRLPGATLYPDLDTAFVHGLLVWQDFMFARFDYPATEDFLAEVRAEAREMLERTAANPGLAVLCGGDEMGQAAAMAGRPAAEWSHPLLDVLAAEAASVRPDAVFVPNAPCGAVPPFAASAPVAHFFGVGAYLRPVHEASGVRFAAACLAFSNPPDAEGCRAVSATPGDAAWAARVPRDPGATWSFEDVRDHYASTLLGADMTTLRRTDPERWLALGRAGVALAMQAALTTWRIDPGCGGALILSLQDGLPGPGWGLLDHAGRPKSALHAVASVLQPLQVLLHDAGLDGVVAHLLNDTPYDKHLRLHLRGLTLQGEVEALGSVPGAVQAHDRAAFSAAEIMGRFVDLAGTWRFGPAPFRALAAVLKPTDGGPISTSTLFPAGALPRERLGLSAAFVDGMLRIGTARFAQFVTIDAGPAVPLLDHFHLWPGDSVDVALKAQPGARLTATVTALNGLDAAHASGTP